MNFQEMLSNLVLHIAYFTKELCWAVMKIKLLSLKSQIPWQMNENTFGKKHKNGAFLKMDNP